MDDPDDRQFRPWRRGLIVSPMLVLAGIAALLSASQARPIHWPLLALSAFLLAVGGLWFKSAYARWNGKHVELSSIKSLDFPDGWSVTPNYLLKGGGDVDLVVESVEGKVFAVEIKSVENVVVKTGFLFLTPSSLVRSDGKKLPGDFLKQTIQNARAMSATPVLWFPKGRHQAIKTVRGVTVVIGGKKHLYKALGCRRLGWLF